MQNAVLESVETLLKNNESIDPKIRIPASQKLLQSLETDPTTWVRSLLGVAVTSQDQTVCSLPLFSLVPHVFCEVQANGSHTSPTTVSRFAKQAISAETFR